jgi:hypothetical protein
VRLEDSPCNEPMNSPDSPTLSTVGLPVSFLVQPARFRSEPSNSDSQKRRWEQWNSPAFHTVCNICANRVSPLLQ